MEEQIQLKQNKKKFSYPSLLVLVLTLITLFFLFQKEESIRLQEASYSFQNITNYEYYAIEKNINDSLVDVELLGSIIESNPDLTRDQFKNYSTHLISHTPEIQALEWIPKVLDKDRATYEKEGSKYYKNFSFTRKGKNGMEVDIKRPIYFPVFYVEPYIGNESALGFNLDTNPARSLALHTAEINQSIIASEGVKLVQEKGSQSGVLIFYPIFQKSSNSTNNDKSLLGFSLVVLRIGDLINRAVNTKYNDDILISLYDESSQGTRELLYQSQNSSKFNQSNLATNNSKIIKIEKPFNIGERKWVLSFVTNPETLLKGNKNDFYLISVLVIAFSSLLIIYIVRKNKTNYILQKSEADLRIALDSGQMGTWKIDLLTNLRSYDDTTFKLLGIDKETFKGTEKEILEVMHPEDQSNFLKMIEQSRINSTRFFVEYRVIWKDRSIHHISSHGKIIKNSKGVATAIYGVLWNDDIRKNIEEKMKNMALTDSLTGLPNRRLLNERIKQTFAINNRLNCYSALMFIDLDRFKDINDTLGHDAGDELLVEISQRLKKSIREVDTLARIGGDEFVILIENIGKNIIESISNTKVIAEHIKLSFNNSYILKGKEIFSTCSIGINVFSKEKKDTEEVIKEADFAMYESKSIGRNEIRFYDEYMQQTITKRSEFELDLQNAIVNNNFYLKLEPVINILDKSIYLLDTKLYWQRSNEERLSLDEFYDLAKQNGSIIEIQKWIIREIVTKLASSQKNTKGSTHIYAMPLSSKSLLHPDFMTFLNNLLSSYKVDSKQLAFSICNDEFHDNHETLTVIIKQIYELGFKIILDNFGQGFISIQSIHTLPLFAIKISENVVTYLNENKENINNSLALIIQLAKMVNINVMAGGIHSQESMNTFKNQDCNLLQGSYISEIVRFDLANL